MITVTDAARAKVLELMKAEPPGRAVRIGIKGRGSGGFIYDLRFVGQDEAGPEDTLFEAGGFHLIVDTASVPGLEGSTLDYVENLQGSGFKIDNPNPVWKDPTAVAVQNVIDEQINPGVAMHGGFITLLDVKDDTAYIALGGGCQGCGMADVTLKQGIEVMIKEAVPAIHRIIDTTDHAGGTNPYYQPAKGGESPF